MARKKDKCFYNKRRSSKWREKSLTTKETPTSTDLCKDPVTIEQETRGQAISAAWRAERAIRLTASNFGTVLGLRKVSSTQNCVNTLRYGTFCSKNMQYGKENESKALEAFTELYVKDVDACGLFVDRPTQHPYLAASPDGLVRCENALVEVRCLSAAARENCASIEDAIDAGKILQRCVVARDSGANVEKAGTAFGHSGFIFFAGAEGTYDACRVWDVTYDNFTPDTIIGHDFSEEGAGIRSCREWTYDERQSYETLVSQWNLVCDQSNLINTAAMVYLAGVAFGGLVSGFLSDRFGRKKTLMVSQLIQLILGLSLAVIPWISLYLILRFFLGFIAVSVVYTGFVLCMELVDGKWRTISGVGYLVPVPLGYITCAGISYLVREWKYNQIALSLPSILLLLLYWVLPESPRWLLTRGKVEENVKLLQEAAKINKRTLPDNIDKLLQSSCAPSSNTDNNGEVSVFDLFRYSNIRRKTLVLAIIWFSVCFIYFGITMNMNFIGGDVFINTVISGLVELPSYAIAAVILLKMGRRIPMSLTLICSGIVCTINAFLAQGTAYTALTMVTRFAISSSNVMMPIYTAELFPTSVRNLGVGVSNCSGGIAMVLVPYLFNLADFAKWLPMGALGIIGFIGGLAALLLPETSQQPMINTIEENEAYYRQNLEMTKVAPAQNGITGTFNKTFSE